MTDSDSRSQLIAKIELENKARRGGYAPEASELMELSEFEQLFRQDRDARDNDIKRWFNERTLEQYLDDCQKRVNAYVEPRKNVDDWQTRYRSLMTRNKGIAIMAKAATIRMKMKFKDQFGGGDAKKLRIFNALYNHAADLDNEDMKQFMQMWSAWVNGTVVVWDRPQRPEKKIRVAEDFDPETGEAKYVNRVIRRFIHRSHIMPLQDVWFGDLRQIDLQQQPHVWLRFEPKYQDFWKDYRKFKNAKYATASSGKDSEWDDTFFRKGAMGYNRVEVLMHLNVWEDRLIIWASKVKIYDGPIPFGDEIEGKHYPLSLGWFELMSDDCVYGKSGADKLRGDHDLFDLFLRKLADRTILISDPPILSQGNPDLPETMNQKPGRVQEVENLEGIRELAYKDNSREIITALQIFKDQAERTSLSDASSGASQPNRTATADTIAENAVKELVGLFQFFFGNFMKQKATIRAKHQLQFIEYPERTTIGEGKEAVFEYPVFTERNTILADGTKGDITYHIVGTPEELPDTETIDMMEAVAKKNGYNVQHVFLTPDYFDGLMTEVEPVPGSIADMSPSLKKAMEVEFQKGFMAFFPEIYQMNKLEFAKDYIEAFERDVDRLMGQEQGQMPMNPQMMPAMAGSRAKAPADRNFGVAKELVR